MSIFEQLLNSNAEEAAFSKAHPRLFKRYKTEKIALEKTNHKLLCQTLRGDNSGDAEYRSNLARIAELQLKMRGK
jgi:hypothetical protein